MDPVVAETLLLARWERAKAVMREHGQDPEAQVWRKALHVYARIVSAAWDSGAGPARHPYVFRLDYTDYDDHAPTVLLCNPDQPEVLGQKPFEFYPLLEGNSTFNHAAFFCMPGDRRAYEVGGHGEWRRKEYFHLDVVLMHLAGLLTGSQYRGRRP